MCFFAFGIKLNKDEMSACEWQTRRALILLIYIFLPYGWLLPNQFAFASGFFKNKC